MGFEAQATVYQELAREVASAELGQQRQELGHSHRESIAQISCHVHHEEAVARTNLFAVNQALTDTVTTANGVEAKAETYLRANHTLEEELEESRAALPPLSAATQQRLRVTSRCHNKH